MDKFANQTIEFKAFIIALIATVIGFSGTAVLFWFNRYDIPLAVLTSGLVLTLTWSPLYINKKQGKPSAKLDIMFIYVRLILIVVSAIVFAILEIKLSLRTISPVYLVVSYLVISLLTLLAYLGRRKNV